MSLRPVGLALLACLASVPASALPAQGHDPESAFHRAYFLEHERGQLEEALALYREVAASASAGPELQREARARSSIVAEDLASQDLAKLLPPETILFAECARPGEALVKVLGQLGLLGSLQEAAGRRGFAVSSELVQAMAGIRGVALALTRLPADGGSPGGVLVLHAGNNEVLRGGLSATILARGTPADPIEEIPAWTIEQRLHVAVTRRLVVAATEREEIAGVLRRLAGVERRSLASHGALQAELGGRAGAPFFCALDAAPVRALLRARLDAAAARDPQARLAAAALDVEHLRALVARLALGDDGLALETDLLLERGHRNLIFNLMRGVPLDPVLLERIPEGVAAFACGALNERGPALAPLERGENGEPVVTVVDFGRELFANLAGYALFVMPGGAPLPKAALVLSSNDPARTGAVLGLLLGFGSVLSGGAVMEGEATSIAGAPTRVFRLALGVPLYLTTSETTLFLSPSEELIEEALDGRTHGSSVLHDEAFARQIGRLEKDTTFALCAHLGRSLATAQPFLGSTQRAELGRHAPLLQDTVVALQTRHSETRLGFALSVQGLPRVDGLVAAALEARRASAAAPPLEAFPTAAHEGLGKRFERLAAKNDGGASARAFAREQLAAIGDDARALNNFAWVLLTEERYAERYDDVALEYALAACKASGDRVWQYLDTLALAQFRAGAVEAAIAAEEKALGLVGAADRGEVEANLARYRAARGAVASGSDPR